MKSQRSMFALSGHGAGGLGGPGLVVNPGLDIDAKTRKYGKEKASEDDN